MALYDRVQYIPLVTVQDATKTHPSMDLLSAQYLEALRNVRQADQWTISDPFASRPDLIANKFFGTPEAWWVICMYNGIVNPLKELTTGRVILIPNALKINQLLQGSGMKDVTGEIVQL